MEIAYVPPPTEFAVLVVHRDTRTSTPFTDHLIQSNAERRRYPAHGRPPLQWVPTAIRTAVRDRAWSVRHVSR